MNYTRPDDPKAAFETELKELVERHSAHAPHAVVDVLLGMGLQLAANRWSTEATEWRKPSANDPQVI